jgi:hypothetical protein
VTAPGNAEFFGSSEAEEHGGMAPRGFRRLPEAEGGRIYDLCGAHCPDIACLQSGKTVTPSPRRP